MVLSVSTTPRWAYTWPELARAMPLPFSLKRGTLHTLAARPFHQWTGNSGDLIAEFYRDGADYIIRFPGLADFFISAMGGVQEVLAQSDAPEALLEHLYHNQVKPLALSRQFQLVLHASAVQTGKACAVFVGASGRGKSTLAAAFANAGHAFLSDDGVRLDFIANNCIVLPGSPSVRLWPDSDQALLAEIKDNRQSDFHDSKTRIHASAKLKHANTACPLTALYVLGEGEAKHVELRTLTLQETIPALMANCFLLDIEESALLRRYFEQFVQLARQNRLYHLDYPRDFNMLDEVLGTVLQHLKALENSA
jgi:hypothetical protein